jgi:hypothetical protein
MSDGLKRFVDADISGRRKGLTTEKPGSRVSRFLFDVTRSKACNGLT